MARTNRVRASLPASVGRPRPRLALSSASDAAPVRASNSFFRRLGIGRARSWTAGWSVRQRPLEVDADTRRPVDRILVPRNIVRLRVELSRRQRSAAATDSRGADADIHRLALDRLGSPPLTLAFGLVDRERGLELLVGGILVVLEPLAFKVALPSGEFECALMSLFGLLDRAGRFPGKKVVVVFDGWASFVRVERGHRLQRMKTARRVNCRETPPTSRKSRLFSPSIPVSPRRPGHSCSPSSPQGRFALLPKSNLRQVERRPVLAVPIQETDSLAGELAEVRRIAPLRGAAPPPRRPVDASRRREADRDLRPDDLQLGARARPADR